MKRRPEEGAAFFLSKRANQVQQGRLEKTVEGRFLEFDRAFSSRKLMSVVHRQIARPSTVRYR